MVVNTKYSPKLQISSQFSCRVTRGIWLYLLKKSCLGFITLTTFGPKLTSPHIFRFFTKLFLPHKEKLTVPVQTCHLLPIPQQLRIQDVFMNKLVGKNGTWKPSRGFPRGNRQNDKSVLLRQGILLWHKHTFFSLIKLVSFFHPLWWIFQFCICKNIDVSSKAEVDSRGN